MLLVDCSATQVSWYSTAQWLRKATTTAQQQQQQQQQQQATWHSVAVAAV
jgi:hypothetical protein